MPYLSDNVFDSGLGYASTNGSRVDICYDEPSNYTEATSTYSLGNETGVSVGTPVDRTGGGRKVEVPEITSGNVTVSGTAAYWALSDGSAELIAAGALSSTQSVTNGNTFTLTAFDIEIQDPV